MQLIMYMLRWQLSTPILAIIPAAMRKKGIKNKWIEAAVANLIGSLIFYYVDKIIFNGTVQ